MIYYLGRLVVFYGVLFLIFDPGLVGLDPAHGRLAGLLMLIGGSLPDLVRMIRQDGGLEFLGLMRQTLGRQHLIADHQKIAGGEMQRHGFAMRRRRQARIVEHVERDRAFADLQTRAHH